MDTVASPEKRRFSPFDHTIYLALYYVLLGAMQIAVIVPYLITPDTEVVHGLSHGWVILVGNLGIILALLPLFWGMFRDYKHPVITKVLIFALIMGIVAFVAQCSVWVQPHYDYAISGRNTLGGFYVGVNAVLGFTSACMGGAGLIGKFFGIVNSVLRGA